MLLSLEKRVNGVLIGCANIVNKGQAEAGNDKNYLYEVEYHSIGMKGKVINFQIVHNREEGIEKLSLLIYQEAYKILKKEDVTEKL